MPRLMPLLFLTLSLPCFAQQGTETVPPLTVTVGLNHAPPYRIVEGGRHSGLYVDIFEAIAERLGWKVRYREAPFRRVLLMVERGEVDVMLGPLRTPSREAMFEFVAAAFPPERRLFFYLGEANRIERYGDLYGKRIGVLEGARYFNRFDQDPDLIKESAARYDNLARMLARGRVDVVIAPELVGLYTLRRQGVAASVSPFFVPGQRSWIAVSRHSEAARYAEDIRAALKLLEMNGTYEALVLKYMESEAL